MNKKIPHEPDYATAPGEVIKEYMESYNIDKEGMAQRTGLDLETTERLLAGEHPVTPEIAAALGGLFQRSTEFWINMEADYQEDKKRLGNRNGNLPPACRKTHPRRRYSIALPNALGRELDARAQAASMTSSRWIVNTLTRALESQ